MTRKAVTVLCLSLALILAGCRQSRPQTQPQTAALKPAPATPIAEQKEELGGKTWDPQWDLVIEQALPPDMLSPAIAHAIAGFCPRFATEPEADKRAFWAYVFQALAGAEAGLDPTINVRHTQPELARIDKVTKRTVRQEGLLQLTYDDAQRYGCDFDWSKDKTLAEHDPNRTILQPARNLGCGIHIMENQIVNQHKPLVVRTSYWSTLHPGTASYRVFAKQMANVPAACGIGAMKPVHKR